VTAEAASAPPRGGAPQDDVEATTAPWPTGRLGAIVDRRGDLRAICLMRALMGLVVIRHLWPDLTAEVSAVERFHVPFWTWLPVPGPGGHRALVVLGTVAGAAMVVGLAARAATVVAAATVTYLVTLDVTSFAHNRGFLVWLLVGLSLLPVDRAWALDARLTGSSHRSTTGLLWPVLGLRVVVSTVYLTSGLTKLADPDWRGGLVLWDRVDRHQHLVPGDGWLVDLLTSRAFHHVLSPAAIAVEVFLGVALWLARTRIAAIWVALAFHASIELVASVQTFSWSAIVALLLWVTPSARDRTVVAGAELGRLVRRLDWLGRFRVGQIDGDPGTPPSLIDRDGRVLSGRVAELTVLSRLPLAFPLAGPALALHRLRHRRRHHGSGP
jgi:uncharacterized membrane protein YphA (DoxX/SURF4 family)